MEVSQYRRAYFAMANSLGMDSAARHEFNNAQTGKSSSSGFSVDDWRLVVSRLQQLTGQNVRLGNPRIRSQRDGTPGEMITPAQLGMIVDLAARVVWHSSPEAFVRARLLSPMRRAAWDGAWEGLFRAEATACISAFQRMVRVAQKTA